VTFARQRRTLLAGLCLATPWPLAFNQTVEWPWVIGLALVCLAALRSIRGPAGGVTVPNWAANALGFAYMAFLWFDLAALNRGQIVRCMTHALIFALALRLFRIEKERDAWTTLLGLFILFLAAMGTSTHPSVVLYLIGWLSLAVLLLARFATFHLFAEFGTRDAEDPPFPFRGLAVGMGLSSALLAVPLWIVLPRLSNPVVAAMGSGGGVSVPLAMLTDEVTLDSIGAMRGNRSVALRAVFDPPPAETDELRFKVGSFDRFEEGRWRPSPYWETRPFDFERRIVLDPRAPQGRVQVWRADLGTSALPLPAGTVALRAPGASVRVAAGGGVSLEFGRTAPLVYEVERAADEAPLARFLTTEDRQALTEVALSPAAREIGRAAMGVGTVAQRVSNLERFLAQQYTYTTDFSGATTNLSIEDFLLREKRGYCEYFASAMVLLLRSEGVPARLVSGFLGAEYSDLGAQYVVRQGNAHAWVEAWIEGEGWRTFDPTPSVGQPGIQRTSGAANLVAMAWEELTYRWDRYVLGYGYDEQRAAMFGWLRRFLAWRERTRAPEAVNPAPTSSVDAPAAAQDAGASGFPAWLWPGLAITAAVAAVVLRRRQLRDGSWAYLEARRMAGHLGVDLGAARGPLAFRELALARLPEAGTELASVVDAYLAESFGRPAGAAGRRAAHEWTRQITALRRAISKRFRAGSRGATSSTGS
jgi:transglutaminase-like putative cysteine protease